MKQFRILDSSTNLRTGFGISIRTIKTRRRFLRCGFLTVLLTFCASVDAQQAAKIPRIGYVSATGDSSNPGLHSEALRQGLRDLGYIEGKSIQIEYRYIEGRLDKVASLVADLVRIKVDVLVVTTLQGIRAAKEATNSIPIVMVTTLDPVGTGIVDSLARPGGNVTGLTRLTRELGGKRMELLKETVPALSLVGIIRDVNSVGSKIALNEYVEASRALKMQIQDLGVKGPNPDLDGALALLPKGRTNGLITITGTLVNRHVARVVDIAKKNRLTAMYEDSRFVEAGGLLSYSTNDEAIYRRAAIYVDKLLKGAKPADLPIEQPTKFEFVVNLKTAKQIGLTIPPNVLARADRVIR